MKDYEARLRIARGLVARRGRLARFGLVAGAAWALTLVGAVSALPAAGPASAAITATVPCTGSGGGAAGLIFAMDAANVLRGGTINLASACTYTLSSADNGDFGGNGLPVVSSNITINGNGSSIVRDSTPGTPQFRILEIQGTGKLILKRLTISGGAAANGLGGGILDGGTLGLSASQVTDNSALGGSGVGGGVMVVPISATDLTPSLSLTSSHVNHNDSGLVGGGIEFEGTGTSTIIGSTVSYNTAMFGGGVDNEGSAVSATSSTFAGNAASGIGGGISNQLGSLSLTKSVITGNALSTSASFEADGGGLYNNTPSLQMASTKIYANVVAAPVGTARGGGLYNTNPNTTFTSGLIANNIATGATAQGGGIYNANGASFSVPANTARSNFPDNCEPAGSVAGCSG